MRRHRIHLVVRIVGHIWTSSPYLNGIGLPPEAFARGVLASLLLSRRLRRQKSTFKSPCITPMGHGEVAIFAVYYLWMSKYQKGTLMRITLRLLFLPSVLFIFVLSACGSQQQPTHAQAQVPAPRFSCTSTSVTSFLSSVSLPSRSLFCSVSMSCHLSGLDVGNPYNRPYYGTTQARLSVVW